LFELAHLRPLPFRLVLDDGTVIERELLHTAIGNTRSYGGGMLVCPGADPTDGCSTSPSCGRCPPSRAAVLPTIFKGTHVEQDEVETYRTASVRVESPGILAYADGEYVAPLPVTVSAVRTRCASSSPAERTLPVCRATSRAYRVTGVTRGSRRERGPS